MYTVVKSKVKISQNFVAFSEYMNFKWLKRKVDIERNISNCIRILIKAWNIEMKWFKIDRLSLNMLWRKKLGDTDEDKNWWDRENQSHFREVPRWEFLWYRNWDLGWIWTGWHLMKKKKIGPIMSNFLGRFFQVFMGKKGKKKKLVKNIVPSALKNWIKWS